MRIPGFFSDWLNRLSIVTKVTLVFSVLVLAATAVVGFLVYSGNSQLVIASSKERLKHNSEVLAVQFSASVKSMHDDIRLLSQNPVFQDFTRAMQQQSDPEKLPRQQVSSLFRSLLQSRPQYLQASFIRADTSKRELVRTDQVEGIITEVPAVKLGTVEGRLYFDEVTDLPPDQIYVSNIALYRENGELHYPYIPTVKASLPVYGNESKLLGILLINLDLTSTFNRLQALTDRSITLYLTNNLGDYLIHPDKEKTFGYEKGKRWMLQNEFPESRAVIYGDKTALQFDEAHSTAAEAMLLNLERLYLFNDNARYVVLGVSSPYSTLLAGLRQVRNTSLLITLAICAGGILLTLFFSRFLIRPLQSITQSVAEFAAGQSAEPLKENRNDEIGVLAQAFNQMVAARKEAEAELLQAKQLAEEANIAKDEFLSVMSHEIRTPMNAVIGMTRLLLQNNPAPPQLPIINTLKFSADNLMALINDILDFSKIQAGKIEFEATDFNLRELLSKIIAAHQPKADEKQVTIALTLAADVPDLVKGDPVRLYQILNNLVGNAVKFTEAGCIAVQVQAANEAPAEVLDLCFEVKDTGIGIAPERLPYIFDRFTQGSSDTTRKYGGSGLGLTITKNLAELQGGHLTTESILGEGSVFRVYLPFQRATDIVLTPTPATAITPTPAAPEVQSLSGRVLYVEDVAFNQFLLQNYLAKTNIILDLADNGQAGIDLAKQNPYDLILMDIQMPDMDGFQATAAIREFNITVPVIAITALTSDKAKERLATAGLNGYIPKPVDQDELFRVLARHLSPAESSIFTPPKKAQATTNSTAEVLDISGLATVYDHEPAKLGKALRLILTEMQHYLPALQQAIELKNVTDFAAYQHKIKPYLQLLQLSELSQALEATRSYIITDTGDKEAVKHNLATAFTEIISQLKQKIEEIQLPVI